MAKKRKPRRCFDPAKREFPKRAYGIMTDYPDTTVTLEERIEDRAPSGPVRVGVYELVETVIVQEVTEMLSEKEAQTKAQEPHGA